MSMGYETEVLTSSVAFFLPLFVIYLACGYLFLSGGSLCFAGVVATIVFYFFDTETVKGRIIKLSNACCLADRICEVREIPLALCHGIIYQNYSAHIRFTTKTFPKGA